MNATNILGSEAAKILRKKNSEIQEEKKAHKTYLSISQCCYNS